MQNFDVQFHFWKNKYQKSKKNPQTPRQTKLKQNQTPSEMVLLFFNKLVVTTINQS